MLLFMFLIPHESAAPYSETDEPKKLDLSYVIVMHAQPLVSMNPKGELQVQQSSNFLVLVKGLGLFSFFHSSA
jgi:hypothetical protein